MKLSDLIQGMTDQRCRINTSGRSWFPFWHFCYVRFVNGKPVVSNRAY